MTDRELIVELCHDLINRAMCNEQEMASELGGYYGTDHRDKERALRRMLAVCDAAVEWRAAWEAGADHRITGSNAIDRLAVAVDALNKETP